MFSLLFIISTTTGGPRLDSSFEQENESVLGREEGFSAKEERPAIRREISFDWSL